MRILIYSDIHIHNFQGSEDRLDNGIQALDAIYKTAADFNCEYIFFGGDLYHLHGNLPTLVVNKLAKYFSELKKAIATFAISGNHDQSTANFFHKPAVTALEHIERLAGGFNVIDNSVKEVSDFKVYGIPYYRDSNHFYQALSSLIESSPLSSLKRNYLLIHQTPDGIGNSIIPTDINPSNELFSGFDYVFCGHIHTRQRLAPNFVVVGSPIHQDKSDYGQKKGVLILDTETNVLAFKHLEGFPEYTKATDIPEEEQAKVQPEFLITDPEIPEKFKNLGAETTNFLNFDNLEEIFSLYFTEVGETSKARLQAGLSLLKP